MEGLLSDLRYSARSLWRAPTFTLVAVATLGLGIGANTAIFSVVDGVLLSALPYDEPDDLVTVWLDMSRRDGPVREWFTPQDLLDYRAEPGVFEEMGGWGPWGPTLTGLGEPEVLTAGVATAGLFERVLRVQPVLGRGFLPEEDLPGAAGTVVVSHRFWTERLGADPGALGRSLVLNEQPYSIVGVLPAGFTPPFLRQAELWAPAQLDPARCGRGCYTIRVVARLADGVPLPLARERASALADRLGETYPDTNADVGAALFPLRDDLVGSAARALWVLLGAVAFVLLIACTNVANLLLARGTARESEFSVRVALGAGRGPLLRQLLSESVLLAGLGGVLGVGLAAWGTEYLVGLAPVSLPGLDDVGVDARILGFTAVVALATGLVFGFVPAIRAGRTDVYAGVRGSRVSVAAGRRLRGGLVVTQVALALVLLVGAGLLTRSFRELQRTDLGFEPEGLLTVGVSLPATRFADAASRTTFYEELGERLEALPGVVSAAGTNSLPFAGNDGDASFRIEGQAPPRPPAANVAWVRPVTEGYFYTMGQALLEGRAFEPGDDAQAPLVVLVNETLARRHFDYPQRSIVGERVAFGAGADPQWRTVIGVVADTRHFGIQEGRRPTRPAMYFPHAQVARAAMTMVVRTDGDPVALAPEVRAIVAELDEGLAASAIRPMTDVVSGTLVTERFVTGLLALFAVLALMLASVGLYGVVSYGVQRRMREMGIRLALGAGGGMVERMVMRGALGLAGLGIAIGTTVALALGGVLEAFLYGVSDTDPVTYGVMIAVLAAVALAASWVPARRAGNADPVSVLREQ